LKADAARVIHDEHLQAIVQEATRAERLFGFVFQGKGNPYGRVTNVKSCQRGMHIMKNNVFPELILIIEQLINILFGILNTYSAANLVLKMKGLMKVTKDWLFKLNGK